MFPTNTFYPVADSERAFLPFGQKARAFRIQPTGEIRNPRTGEWYLSGAIVEGYYVRKNAPSSAFPIGRLVKVCLAPVLSTEEVLWSWKW
jgi:hypothetical protein